jgi:hypothetical protein
VQKTTSNVPEANRISNERHLKRATLITPLKQVLNTPIAGSTDPMAEVGPRTWTARLKTDHVAIFPVNGSKIPNAVAAAASAVIVLEAEGSAAVTASAAEGSVAVAALADSAGAGAEADANN